MEYFIGAIRKYAEFSGRSTRKEYWMYYLIYFLIYIVLAVIDGIVGVMIFTSIFSLALMIPSVSITARRLHDTGRSGWWQLILFVPLIGLIVMIIFLVQDSSDSNKYGTNPELAGV